MTLQEIQQNWISLGISRDLYFIGEGNPSEAYCIYEKDGLFITYYSERGERRGERRFSNGKDAYEYLLPKLVKYDNGCKKRNNPR